MVRALLELEDDVNQKLNLIKAQYRLKDKSDAVSFMVRNFKDPQKNPQFNYSFDGDKWMLGEDIPDIDFYFCQIWLSGFVNEFAYPSGRAFKKILAVYEGYHLNYYFGNDDSLAVAKNILNKFLEEPNFAKEVNKKIVLLSAKLRAYCETIPERNLNFLTNQKLLEICEKQDELHTEYYQWGWIPVVVDMFHSNFTDELKKYLSSISVPEEKISEYFLILTHPMKKSLIQVEQEEFLEIALKIKENAYHCKLFEQLYSNFNEKDVAKFGYKTHTAEYEALLESKTTEIVSKIKPEIYSKIKSHYEKYFYVNHMWVGKASTFERYLKDLVKLIGTHADVGKMLSDLSNENEEAGKKRKKLLLTLKIEKKYLGLFDAFGEFMITKIYRRFAQIYAMYKMDFVLTEISKRFGITLMEVRFMLPSEIKEALLNGTIDKDTLKERSKFCVYYAQKGVDAVYTGERANEIAESAKKIEVSGITEVRGQVACLGKATGKVKIIIRPSDMLKMQKGDILVSIATDPDIVPAMKKAAAIVTEQGGVTSHAAIVSRELGVPCVIGTKIATKVFQDGDLVEVDAIKGIVRKIESK